MKQTVFRKVYTKDRLPTSFGSYITNLGEFFYHNSSKLFESSSGFIKPEWWLEQIELSADNELYKESRADYIDTVSFLKGAFYILNKLK